VSHEVGDRERLVRLDEVQPVMGHVGAIRRGHLGGADVQPTEDLARVGGDDLCGDALGAQRASDAEREAGLAGGGRAGDDEERRAADQAPWPRSA